MSSVEGCVSFEEVLGETIRDNKIDVLYQTLDGQFVQETLIGNESAAFQHEIDHLNGITLIKKGKCSQLIKNDKYYKWLNFHKQQV